MSNAFNRTWSLLKRELDNEKSIKEYQRNPVGALDLPLSGGRGEDHEGNPEIRPPVTRLNEMGREKQKEKGEEYLNPIRVEYTEDKHGKDKGKERVIGKRPRAMQTTSDDIRALRRIRENESANRINREHPSHSGTKHRQKFSNVYGRSDINR
tara:strand:- start:12477 stop:12935 length:459 start_codon:yes stop_codon:yes gene_type:complete